MKVFSAFGVPVSAALAACILLASCVGDTLPTLKTTPNNEKIEVTVALDRSQQKVRTFGPAISQGLEVEISNGYLVFLDENDLVTQSHAISRTGNRLAIEGGVANNDHTISLSGVPALSTAIWVVTNFNDDTRPMVGETLRALNIRCENALTMELVSDARHMPASGFAELQDAGDGKKTASVDLIGYAARLQIAKFSTVGVSCTIDGIFLNRLNTTASAWLDNGSEAAHYASGTEQYPEAMRGLTHDTPAVSVENNSVTNFAGNVYGYGLIAPVYDDKPLPQIIVKLSGVKIQSEDGRTTTLPDPQFVTVSGFKDKSGKKLGNFAVEMIYTVDKIEITPQRLAPRPNMKPVDVSATMLPVTWSETKVDAEY